MSHDPWEPDYVPDWGPEGKFFAAGTVLFVAVCTFLAWVFR